MQSGYVCLSLLVGLSGCFRDLDGAESARGGARDTAAEATPLQICAGAGSRFFVIEDGQGKGLEFDLLSGFAASEGRSFEIVALTGGFTSVFESVNAGRCDVAAWMITGTPERAERVDLSRPYFPVRGVLIGLEDRDVNVADGLAGIRIGGPRGIWFEDSVLEVTGNAYVPATTLNLFEMLETDVVDAVVVDSSIVPALLEGNPELVVKGSFSERTEHYVFALPKASPDTAALDRYIERQRSNGGYAATLGRYFDAEIVEEVVASLSESDPLPGH